MGKIKNLAAKWAKIKKWAKLDGQNFAPEMNQTIHLRLFRVEDSKK